LMDSDLAWVNGKSGRQSWRYHADAFQRSIISEAIYHLFTICVPSVLWYCWLGLLTCKKPSPV